MQVVRDWRLNGPRKEFSGVNCVVCQSKSLDPSLPVCRGCGVVFKPYETVDLTKTIRITLHRIINMKMPMALFWDKKSNRVISVINGNEETEETGSMINATDEIRVRKLVMEEV